MNVTVDYASYDVIAVSSSGGKDSQAALGVVVAAAQAAGVMDRVHVIHCDLGRAEWAGTQELTIAQAKAYGIPEERIHVTRAQDLAGNTIDLVAMIERRGKFPSNTARYCTSDAKRGPTFRVFTKLTKLAAVEGRPVRILDVQGIRAEESAARSKKLAFSNRKMASNGKRTVDEFYPIFTWTTAQVWDFIKASGVQHHKAYDLGMPRLSCVFCVLGNRDSLLLAGEHNPELLNTYVQLEKRIGHTLQQVKTNAKTGNVTGMSAARIQDLLAQGVRANPLNVQNWCM
jgi:3'-phosphoadenosine 5'-phosphosulfate sulfotransferase (PAPS reductase)/FAD synthetase